VEWIQGLEGRLFFWVALRFECFPHVLPHDVTPIISALKWAFWDRPFGIAGRVPGKYVPYYDVFWEVAAKLPGRTRSEYYFHISWLKWFGDQIDVEQYNALLAHLWESAQKLVNLLTGYVPEPFPTDLRSGDIPKYLNLSIKAAQYLHNSTHFPYVPVAYSVNRMKRVLFKVEDAPYKRLAKVGANITYEEYRPITSRRYGPPPLR